MSTIVLMRGTRNVAVTDVYENEFKDIETVYWDEFNGAKRKSVFDYSHTTKRGRVYRERKFNVTSMFIPYIF